jgi:hypothetical protein
MKPQKMKPARELTMHTCVRSRNLGTRSEAGTMAATSASAEAADDDDADADFDFDLDLLLLLLSAACRAATAAASAAAADGAMVLMAESMTARTGSGK